MTTIPRGGRGGGRGERRSHGRRGGVGMGRSLEAGASSLGGANTGAAPTFLLEFVSVGEFMGHKSFQSLQVLVVQFYIIVASTLNPKGINCSWTSLIDC